jgi:hypothetical protein
MLTFPASNPFLMKRGSPAPVLASACAMKLAACCCTQRYCVVCSRRGRSCSGAGSIESPLGLSVNGLREGIPAM